MIDNNLQNKVEEFYGIHPFSKKVRGPFIGTLTILDYTLEETKGEIGDERPSELIKIISSLGKEDFDNSKLSYSQVRESYERYNKKTVMNLPLALSWCTTTASIIYSIFNPLVGLPLAIGSVYFVNKFTKERLEKLRDDKKEFDEFEKLWKISGKINKFYEETKW